MENNKTKRQNIYKLIMLVVLTTTVTFMITTLLMYNKFQDAYNTSYLTKENGKNSSNDVSMIKTLESFKAMLQQKYIGEIDAHSLDTCRQSNL